MQYFIKDFYDGVKLFHQVFGHPCPESIVESVDEKLSLFRHKLLLEEFNEFEAALTANDKKEELDGIADMLYVSYGALISFGFSFDDIKSTTEYSKNDIKTQITNYNKSFTIEDIKKYYTSTIILIMTYCNIYTINIEPIFAEVQRSNMSKVCSTIDEAIATVEKYKSDPRYQASYKEVMNKFVVFNTIDGKILKSINFSEPNLSKFL